MMTTTTVELMSAVRAPELDSMCDRPSEAPAWRVLRGGQCLGIAEAATAVEAIAYVQWEQSLKAR